MPQKAVLAGAIGEALARVHRAVVEVDAIETVAGDRAAGEPKQVGYGEPLLVRYRALGRDRRAVFRTHGANWFGHDRRADRAALALLAADSYGEIPDHVRVLDVGALRGDGTLLSLRGAGEFYLLTTFVDGELYARDLRRIEREGRARKQDVARACALAAWLGRLHAEPVSEPPEVYRRAVRDLLGSGEGIFGLVDSYPDEGPVARQRLVAIEHAALDWRHALRSRHDRVRRTHGDFHPYNVVFREGDDFSVLDASRGGRGDPADDVAAMTVNYLFGGVTAPGSWRRGLRPLWDSFFATYLEATGDRGLLGVVAPFLAWRLLVVASPVWYPSIRPEARDALLSIAEHALSESSFDPRAVAHHLEAQS